MSCGHRDACPDGDAPDAAAAVPVARQPEQGWSLLCNGVLLFDDTGAVLPDGDIQPPAGTGARRSESAA
ncbi:hypothetical protein KNE206_67640 [Kitasatospora sp. NE20-6]|uniref:DUF5999 family protein n=1 Tax=Kitasatospora sp. NE20-6 TaxID=2859066 RepID=UPI0034DC403F